MGISPKAPERVRADDRRMGRNALQTAWLYHRYLALAVAVTAFVTAGAHGARLGNWLTDRTGLSLDGGGAILVGALATLLFVGAHAWVECRRRMRFEWNLVRVNLNLRQSAALMEHLARADALTGLNNRRAWFEKLDQEWLRAQRYGSHPAVIMLDLDAFKAVNDRYGHRAGDALLRQVGEMLNQSLRASDVVARLGGDEFAVLLPDASRAEAAGVAEKMRGAVAAHLPAGVTLSVGVASAQDAPELDARGLLQRADRALYDAKAAGRNRVRVAGEAA